LIPVSFSAIYAFSEEDSYGTCHYRGLYEKGEQSLHAGSSWRETGNSASQRKQALGGSPKNKEIVLALREIAAGEVDFDSVTLIEQDQLSKGASEPSPEASEEGTPSEEVKEEAPATEEEVNGGEETKKTDDAVDQG
jgi:hypothetical protein